MTKGKGKQRAELEGPGDGVGAGREAGSSLNLKGVHTPAKREEVVRLMLQAMRDVGYRSVYFNMLR